MTHGQCQKNDLWGQKFYPPPNPEPQSLRKGRGQVVFPGRGRGGPSHRCAVTAGRAGIGARRPAGAGSLAEEESQVQTTQVGPGPGRG